MGYLGGEQQSASAVILPIPASDLSWRLQILFLFWLCFTAPGGRRSLPQTVGGYGEEVLSSSSLEKEAGEVHPIIFLMKKACSLQWQALGK